MHPGVKPKEESPELKPQSDKFPVRIKFGYYPKDKDWPRHPSIVGQPIKAERGSVIHISKDEAREIIARGLGERADEIPL